MLAHIHAALEIPGQTRQLELKNFRVRLSLRLQIFPVSGEESGDHQYQDSIRSRKTGKGINSEKWVLPRTVGHKIGITT